MTYQQIALREETTNVDQGHPSNILTKPSSGEFWIARNRQRLRGKLPGHSRTALTKIYSPPEQQLRMSSEGIVAQALCVVSAPAVTHASTDLPEANLKKVSKRRKKANGEVHLEHTNSSNEFLRKLQQTLNDCVGESSEEERPEGDEFWSDRESDGEPQAPTDRNSSISLLRNRMQSTMKTNKQQPQNGEESEESDIQEDPQPRYPTLLRNSVQYSRSSKHSSCHIVGHEGPPSGSTASSSFSNAAPISNSTENDLGYEDPDKVMGDSVPQRFPRMARRRNSVTEQMVSAQLQGSELARSDATTDNAATKQRLQDVQDLARKTRASWFGRESSSDRALNVRSGASLLHQALEATDRRRLSLNSKSSCAGTSSEHYGYEAMGMATRDFEPNSYGYENPDATTNQLAALGYENPDALNTSTSQHGDNERSQPRQRPRAQRRGSVTKFSLQVASHVEAAFAQACRDEDDATGRVEVDKSLPPNLGIQAPAQPTRKISRSSNLAARSAPLGREPQSLAPPTVRPAPPLHAASFRSESSFRSSRSGDILYDSSDDDNGDDEEDNECKSIGSSSDESSLGEESITSLTVPLKDCAPPSSRRDGPMRPPDRRDSMRSFASRGSTRSVRTVDSDDGDSLAPDMKSLCSISQHERTVDRSASSSLPMFLPHTPTPESQLKKFMSPRVQPRRSASGDMVPTFPVETFINTSPLPSPKIKGLQPGPKDISLKDSLSAVSLDVEMTEHRKSTT